VYVRPAVCVDSQANYQRLKLRTTKHFQPAKSKYSSAIHLKRSSVTDSNNHDVGATRPQLSYATNVSTSKTSSSSTTNGRPPKAEQPKFDGNPISWPMFIQSFKVQIHDKCFSDAERKHHLRASLTTQIQNHLGEVLLNHGLYSFALKELHRKLSNTRIVSTACSSSLLKLPLFKDSDYESLKQFSSTLRSVLATLQLGGYGLELHSSTTLAQLVGKLPPTLRSKWAKVSYRIQDRLPTILDLDTWLDDVTMAECFVRVGVNPTPQQGSHPKTRENVHRSSNEKQKKSTMTPMVFSTTVKIASCPHCDGAHCLYLCEKFKALNPAERSEIVKEKRCCYQCLDDRHLSSECMKEK
ncbi:Uncharacterized protein APZ42_001683, partial [Daphnia magna]